MAPRASGVIVNMASICGIEGCTGHPHYSAAKAGILGVTRAAAKELIVQGIRVNAIAPGFVDTTRLKGDLDAGRRAQAARTPAGRLVRRVCRMAAASQRRRAGAAAAVAHLKRAV
jgi:3-oxoacyl-[acyl-carrier protein] reductase